MEPKNDRTARTSRAPARRFRIEKLEERIAPRRGGNGTNKCGYYDDKTLYCCNGNKVCTL
jgi:hypothetical protein